MRFIICYDISDDKKRSKLSRKLKSYGIRTQLSVFEVETSKETIFKLLKEVNEILNPVDKFFVYPLEDRHIKEIIRLGAAEKGELLYIV